ncbi:hypothetical protein AOLI_G00248840 [Acnodon oligacanthus]
MQLKSFQERDKTLLHEDVAVGLSTFEQKLCSHFCRVEIKDEINTTDDNDGSEPENAAMDDAMSVPRQKVCSDSIRAEIKNPGKKIRTLWSKQEVKAVMKHFKSHMTKGKLATMAECQQCKDAEAPVLAGQTV